MDEDLAAFALDEAAKAGASFAEVTLEETLSRTLVLKNGVLDTISAGRRKGVGVKVLLRGGAGFGTVNSLNRKGISDAVEEAMAAARSAGRRDPIELAEVKAVRDSWKVSEKVPLAGLDTEGRVERLNRADRAAVDSGVNLVARLFVLQDKVVNRHFANSDGARITSRSPRLGLYYYLTVMENGETEQAFRYLGGSGGWEVLEAWGLEERIHGTLTAMARTIKEGVPGPKGKTTVICGPQVSGIASHESCGHPIEADRILGREAAQAGKSFMTPDSLGEVVGSPVVNVVDDPTLEGGFGHYMYDDEGVPARKRHLYKEGRVHEFLHNRESAARMGVESNASARRTGFDREAIPRMANTFVEPGDWTRDELIADTREGVLMETYSEWNIDDQRKNQKYVGQEAYLIRDGELGPPVRKPVLELTTVGFWSAVDAVAKEIEFEAGLCGKSDPMQGLDVCFGGPPIRLRDVPAR
jgi:TldD protein